MHNGFILLDKPLGFSSNWALSKVKRLFKTKSAGFVGTLDPLASGVLIIALGEATKLIPYIDDDLKTYQFHIKWGFETTTLDLGGETTETGGRIPSFDDIKSALTHFEGQLSQMPPQYSAIKIKGKRAYDLARKGKTVELKHREVNVGPWEGVKALSDDETFFEVRVSKGTYIRSLARDIAHHLGTYGTVSFLRRTKVGAIDEKSLLSLEKLGTMQNSGLQQAILPLKTLLTDISAFAVSDELALRFSQGQRIRLTDETQDCDLVFVTQQGREIGLGKISRQVLHPLRIFNFNLKGEK